MCTNKALKFQKSFIVNRIKPTNPSAWHDTTFVAKLKAADETNMATLEASTKGYCNCVATIFRYQQCGLSKALMKVCFTDNRIICHGGFNPLTDSKWKDESIKTQVKGVCRIMIYLQCKADELKACNGYLKAALEEKFDMLFTERKDDDRYSALKIVNAIDEFAAGPQAFLTKYGFTWFLCHCEESKKSECFGLINAAKNVK